jgi:hypothetical protein
MVPYKLEPQNLMVRQIKYAPQMLSGSCLMQGEAGVPKDHALIADGLKRADVVVIGMFRLQRSFPWFDGWHRRGAIEVEAVLYGNVEVGNTLLGRAFQSGV